MRIGDAVQLTVSEVNGNRLFLYTQKTGVPVNVISASVCDASSKCRAPRH